MFFSSTPTDDPPTLALAAVNALPFSRCLGSRKENRTLFGICALSARDSRESNCGGDDGVASEKWLRASSPSEKLLSNQHVGAKESEKV